MHIAIQVDGAYAAVRFPPKDGIDHSASGPPRDDLTTLLQDCRLLRKDELQVVRGSSAPRVPDCFQKVPKRIALGLPDIGQILAVAVDIQGQQITAASASVLTFTSHFITSEKNLSQF